jgi:diadenylate cyclase
LGTFSQGRPKKPFLKQFWGDFMERFRQWASLLTEIGFSGLCDIGIVTLMIYVFLVALKRTRRSGLIFAGIVIVAAVYLAALKFNLLLTVALLHGFFTVILVALVVIFQEDLRYFFERVATWWLKRSFPLHERKTARQPRREGEILARTLGDLARAKIGALVVIQGNDPIARHLEGGEDVKGLLSEPLLKSIFDPHSIGHDGAVVVEGNLINKLGCHLPLSKNLEKLPHSGTRHAAALGLTERSDALCLVVSEEYGTMSVSRHGDIWTVSTSAALADLLEAFYDEIAPQAKSRSWTRFLLRNYREKVVSFLLALALWLGIGYSGQIVQRALEISVGYGSLPSNLIVANIVPPKVRVTFSGQRKAFAFLKVQDIKLVLPLWDARKGRHRFFIKNQDLSYPTGLGVEDIEPRQLFLDIENKPPEENKNHKPGKSTPSPR